jgi:hypothetical protein
MEQSDMNLREQQYVCTIAKTGSLTAAAKILRTSQPNLSLFVSNLERALNVQLFDRIGKQFRLTYAGELYVAKAQAMLSLKDEFDAELANISENGSGRLRLGFQYFRSSRLIPSLLAELSAEYPRVEFSFEEETLSKLEAMLSDNTIDLFFCNCPSKRPEFEYHPLYHDSVLFMTSVDHPLTANLLGQSNGAYPWVSLKLFEDEQFFLSRHGGSLRAFIDQVLEATHVNPHHVMTFDKIETIMELVAQGQGVGFCANSYQSFVGLSRPLRLFSVGNRENRIEFCAVNLKGKVLPPYAKRAIELVRALMEGSGIVP